MNYYKSIANQYGWMETSPKKSAVIENAKKAGRVTVLENSNNRAVVIDTDNETFLQSYDTLILRVDKGSKTINKLWDGYTKTTFKHVNDFLRRYGLIIESKAVWKNTTTLNY